MLMTHAKDFRPDAIAPVLPVRPSGLFPGTLVETAAGWRDIAGLIPGDLVYTFDGGLRPVSGLRRAQATGDAIRVPDRVLGNDSALSLAPDQLVMVDTGRAYDWLGSPVALVRAEDLVGLAGIRRRAARRRRCCMPVIPPGERDLLRATGLRVHARDRSRGEHFMCLNPRRRPPRCWAEWPCAARPAGLSLAFRAARGPMSGASDRARRSPRPLRDLNSPTRRHPKRRTRPDQ